MKKTEQTYNIIVEGPNHIYQTKVEADYTKEEAEAICDELNDIQGKLTYIPQPKQEGT